MKYLNIYQKNMIRYKNNIEKARKGLKFRIDKNEWTVILESISHPLYSPERMAHFLNEKYGIETDREYVERTMDTSKLTSPEIRRKESEKVFERLFLMKKMLNGDKEACQEFGKFIAKAIYLSKVERVTNGLPAKLIVTYMCYADKDLSSEEYHEIPNNYREPYCQRILRDIYSDVAKELGLEDLTKHIDTNKLIESSKEIIQDTERRLTSETNTSDEKDAEIERLNAEIADLRNSLQVLEVNLEEITENIEAITEASKNSAISDFFISLNSKEYGNILDTLALAEQNIKSLRRQKIQLPPLMLNLPIVIKQLLKFLDSVGVKKIDEAGREFTAKYSELEGFNYQGSSYIGDEEKEVYISSPGWHYGDIVISQPTVSEK